jgi:phosphatidylglycerophosphate synthase
VFDTITNLPWHPLVVHAVIVLVPLSCLGAVLVAVKAPWNRLHGFLVLASSFVAAGAAVVAKESGEKLASRTGVPTDHSQWGKWVVISAGLLFLSVAALWWLDRRNDVRSTAIKALAVLQIVLAAVAFTFVVLAGHSGATAVWGPIIQHTTPGTFPVG